MRQARDQFDEMWVARCRKCGIARFHSQSEEATRGASESDAHWDVLAGVGTLPPCCQSESEVELLVCPECARVPGPLAPGSYDKRLPDVNCGRCGRPYRGLP